MAAASSDRKVPGWMDVPFPGEVNPSERKPLGWMMKKSKHLWFISRQAIKTVSRNCRPCTFHIICIIHICIAGLSQRLTKPRAHVLPSELALESCVVDGEAVSVTSRTVRRWLNEMGFRFSGVKENVYFDGHERPDVVDCRMKFVQQMEALKPYLVEFEADGTIKGKIYPEGCRVQGDGQRPIITITHDECTFSVNDGVSRAWLPANGSFLRPKGKGQGIVVCEFLRSFSRLNLLALPENARVRHQEAGVPLEAVKTIEYGKSHDGYWNGWKLLQQIVEKALPIAEALYPGYAFLFHSDNATSHALFADNALKVSAMNKGRGGKQAWPRDGYYTDAKGLRQTQKMSTVNSSGAPIQKGIQGVLEDRGLWPAQGLPVECPRVQCALCQAMNDCQSCVKGQRCEPCKLAVTDSSADCSKSRLCDACAARSRQCSCRQKQYCDPCAARRAKKCGDCEMLPPRCSYQERGERLSEYTSYLQYGISIY